MIQQFQVIILLLSWPIKSMAKAAAAPPVLTKPNCASSCGNNVTIPFPFGIGTECYLDQRYAIECKSNKPFLKSIGLEFLNVSLHKSTILVNQPVISSCQDKTAQTVVDDDKECINGIECCQSGYSFALQSFTISVSSIDINGTRSSSSQQQDCKYAFLVDIGLFRNNFNSSKNIVQNWNQVPVAMDWRLPNSSYYKLAMNRSTTFESTFYCETDNETGLKRCYCRDGYQGNPYLFQGCQDIDEYKSGDPRICETNMVCQNYVGGHHCIPRKSKVSVIILGIGTCLGGLFLLIGAWWLGIIIRKRMKQKEENFKRNGGLLLLQQLNSFDGSVDRCKIFNSNELDKATDHFNVNRILGQGGQGTVYKGMLADGGIIAVKKSKVVNEGKLEEFINEVLTVSQINHRNVVKLLGCCLETDAPLLVYEFIPNGTLFKYLLLEIWCCSSQSSDN